jgi:hypothetical protein
VKELGGDAPLARPLLRVRKRSEGSSAKDLRRSGVLRFCRAAVAECEPLMGSERAGHDRSAPEDTQG